MVASIVLHPWSTLLALCSFVLPASALWQQSLCQMCYVSLAV